MGNSSTATYRKKRKSSTASCFKVIGCGDNESVDRDDLQAPQEDIVDRISKLPESIISLILSFLPTKTAVTTSVLSRSWRFLWTTAFNLDFDHRDFRDSEDEKRSTDFVQYVNWVLLHQTAGYINKFSLVWFSEFIIPASVYAWVSTAVFRYVKELHVSVRKDVAREVPIQMPIRDIFMSEKLLSLELGCNISIPSAMAVSLPRIERLKLVSVRFENPKAFQQLITGCPVLKYLDLDLKAPWTAFEYKVSSTSLIRFKFFLQDMYGEVYDVYTTPFKLELEAPSLEFLELDGLIYWISVRGTLRSLVQARLRIKPSWDIYDQWEGNYCNLIVLAIRALNYARTLFLSGHLVWALTCASIKLCTKFDRLKELKVQVPYGIYFVSVLDFIQCSDNLQILTVAMECFADVFLLPNQPSWRNPENIPICLSNSLKIVNLPDYDGCEEGYKMVDYMLRNGDVMEVMEMDFKIFGLPDYDRDLKLARDISEIPRKSPTCKVKIPFYNPRRSTRLSIRNPKYLD